MQAHMSCQDNYSQSGCMPIRQYNLPTVMWKSFHSHVLIALASSQQVFRLGSGWEHASNPIPTATYYLSLVCVLSTRCGGEAVDWMCTVSLLCVYLGANAHRFLAILKVHEGSSGSKGLDAFDLNPCYLYISKVVYVLCHVQKHRRQVALSSRICFVPDNTATREHHCQMKKCCNLVDRYAAM